MDQDIQVSSAMNVAYLANHCFAYMLMTMID